MEESRRLRITPEEEDSGKRIDAFLSERIESLSRTRVQDLIRTGKVHSPRGPVERANTRILVGDWVEVDLPPPIDSAILPEDLPIQILHADEDIAVVVKPAGMPTHPTALRTTGTLVNALQHHLQGLSAVGGVLRAGIVHRLDRGTSGILVTARNDLAHHHLAHQFKQRSVKKTYRAVALGSEPPAEGIIQGLIDRHPTRRKRMLLGGSTGRESETAFRVVGHAAPLYGFLLNPHTGRTHQIRVHLEKIHCPIVLDDLYGYDSRRWPLPGLKGLLKDYPGILLHAEQLEFDHPRTGERMVFRVPPPEVFQTIWTSLFHEPPEAP